jgi:hypothetical protein
VPLVEQAIECAAAPANLPVGGGLQSSERRPDDPHLRPRGVAALDN